MSKQSGSKRRTALKNGLAALGGLAALRSTTVLAGASASSTTRDKRAYVYGRTDINQFDDRKYYFAVDGDYGKNIAKYSDCESYDVIGEEGRDGELVDYAAGSVTDGKKDVYEFGSIFKHFYAYKGTNYDVQIEGDHDTTRKWQITIEGDVDYTVYFAGDKRPERGNNMEGDEQVGVNYTGSYVNGSTRTDENGKPSDKDTFTVWGDVTRIWVDNYQSAAIHQTG